MSRFLIYDPDPGTRGFYKTYVKRVTDLFDAKHWRRKYAAMNMARLMNVRRNIPPGLEASKHYRNLPNVVVVEYDDRWTEVARHPAPPEYIDITTKG